MFRVIRFGAELEPLVGFVEETLPDRIVEETVGKLRSGTDPDRMMTALALAAIRSTEMPFVHHGGPLHPVAALPAVRATMARLPADRRELPLIQDVALANAHIHDVASGPYMMPKIEPVGEGSVEATREAFFGCLRRNYPNAAEHYFLWLLENAPRDVALEALVRVAVENYRFDEHKLIAAVNSIRLLEVVGWDLAPVVLRPVVRYNFMPSVWADAPPADTIENLMTQYRLDQELRWTVSDELPAVASLRQDLLALSLDEQAERIAKALASGLSLQGVGEAIALAASEIFVRRETTNPMGIHAMTGANALSWVAQRFPSLGARGLLFWTLGPETQDAHGLTLEPEPESVCTMEAVLEAIRDNEGDRAAACVRGCCREGKDLDALWLELGLWASRDSATEMHAMKHHQAIAEAFDASRLPASVHLEAQAKEAALHAGKHTAIYDRAVEALGIPQEEDR